MVKSRQQFQAEDVLSTSPTAVCPREWEGPARWTEYLGPDISSTVGGPKASRNGSSDASAHTSSNKGLNIQWVDQLTQVAQGLVAKMYRFNQILDYPDITGHAFSEAFWKSGVFPNHPKICILLLKKFPKHHSKLRLERITFDAMCDMLMSMKDASLLEQIEKDCTAVSDDILSFAVMIPGTRYYKGIKARRRLMETFKAIITTRRNGKESHEDFLQSMLEKDSSPPNQKLDDAEIMDNLLTLIIAGQTTTAAAMMWSVKFLDEHREVQDRLREEQLLMLKSKPNGSLLTLDDLNNMSYASKVVKETLRMSNVLLWFPRVALNDCNIEGFEIKKGMHVNIDATCIHYDPGLYKDPLQFNPSRFDDMQKPYSYIPFGSGPRTCLGINMAKVTMLVFLHRLTSGYKWTVDDQDLSLERKSHIPRLKSGCPITLTELKDE